MVEYDLYVPLFSNEGKRFSQSRLATLKKHLISKFGGLTHFPQKNKGVWKIGRATFRDEIVILRVISKESSKVREFWKQLKCELQAEWNQRNVLIVARKIRVI